MSLLEQLQKFKTLGNGHFQTQAYNQAIEAYTEACDLFPIPTSEASVAKNFPSDVIEPLAAVYSNQSLCHFKTEEYRRAYNDASKAILLRPNWIRGYTRRCVAADKLDRWEEAVADFTTAHGINSEEVNENDVLKQAAKRSRDQARLENQGCSSLIGEFGGMMRMQLQAAGKNEQRRQKVLREFYDMAMGTGAPPAFDFVLSQGVSANDPNMFFPLIDRLDFAELGNVSARDAFLAQRMLERLCAQAKKQNVKFPSRTEVSRPLHFACSPYVPNIIAVRTCVEGGIQDIDSLGGGATALGTVCGSGVGRELPRGFSMRDKEDARFECAAYLLENGANPNIPDSDGFSPLMTLGEYKHQASMFRLLLAHGADVHFIHNHPSAGPMNALSRAIAKNDEHSVRVLLEAGAKLIETSFVDGRAPKFSPDMSRLLQRGSPLISSDESSENPADRAAKPSLELVRLVLQQNDYQNLSMNYVQQEHVVLRAASNQNPRKRAPVSREAKEKLENDKKMFFVAAFVHGQSLEIVEYLLMFDPEVVQKTKNGSHQIWQAVADSIATTTGANSSSSSRNRVESEALLTRSKKFISKILEVCGEDFKIDSVGLTCSCGCGVVHASNILSRGNKGKEFLDWLKRQRTSSE